MKKFLKKNNKGFSLVELIVVVLIIAIIAVALAPQVIKWVGQASDNTKKSNQATIKSAIQTATAEFIGDGGTIAPASGKEFTVEISTSGVATIKDGTGTATPGTGKTALIALINAALEDLNDGNTYSYTISATGVVKVVE